MYEIDFAAGSVPIKVAARVYGKSTEWVREGMINGYLPIGVTLKKEGKKRTNYYISPKLLYEHTGYIWKGEKE